MKTLPLSLRVLLIHLGLVLVFFLLHLTPLAHKPGSIHPLLVLPFLYLLLSGIPFLGVIIRGAFELKKEERAVGTGVAIVISVICLVLMGWSLSLFWTRMMSV